MQSAKSGSPAAANASQKRTGIDTKGSYSVIHLGDITKINGANVPPVMAVCGGSPCQDLSVAGKRAGLQHADLGSDETTRSGLFMEQIRVTKEMRENEKRIGRTDVDIRPRYEIWENVVGAFSSNGGRDFQAVLTEFVRIAEPQAPDVPLPAKGKWPNSGLLMGDNWSVAWRTHDAQYWGVPQRRRRISVVADFAGWRAGEILFESESMPWYPDPCGTQRQGTSPDTERGSGETGFDGYNGQLTGNVSSTLGVNCGISTGRNGVLLNDQDSRQEIRSYTVGGAGTGSLRDEICGTVTGDHESTISNTGNLVFTQSSFGNYTEAVGTLRANGGDLGGGSENLAVPYTLQERAGCAGGGKGPLVQKDKCASLRTTPNHTLFQPIENTQTSTVRRLTPTECERLQNFGDEWTNIGDWVDSQGKKHKYADGPRYKALGNSIALPFWRQLAGRITALEGHGVTMASLFDGIGGFPKVFEEFGGKAVWASEIEEFPIAVTKIRFPEDVADE